MRFAIPVKEGVGLDAPIDASLSECHRLLVVDTEGHHLKSLKVVFNETPGDCGSMVTKLGEEHVRAAVFTERSPEDSEALSLMDIATYVGAYRTPREALCDIFEGWFQDAQGASLCGRRVSAGVVAEPQGALRVGDPAPNLSFYGPDGKLALLSDVRGDVSVLALVGLRSPRSCTISANAVRLAEKYSGPDTSVKFICISEASQGACDVTANVIQRCRLHSDRVIGLCDSGTTARTLYRATGPGAYYVIGHNWEVVGMGELDDTARMEKAVRKAVCKYRRALSSALDD